MINSFYKGKRVFITGHTGFKGSWICKILKYMGAEIRGFSLESNSETSLYNILNIKDNIDSVIGDVRSLNELRKSINEFKPEIIFHLAAQPIVKEGYRNPIYTYETNVMGTVNLLESIRECDSVRSVVNITTDKVYKNNEWSWPYRENDELNGFDPYSNSKSCSELITDSYKKSFFFERDDLAISTARAGNVIGGGDFAPNRIIPDCIRAVVNNEDIIVRNPNSLRPYQHVFEALLAYLMIAKMQYEDKSLEGCYNIGPKDDSCINTGELAQMFCDSWGGVKWISIPEKNAPHESNILKLDSSMIRKRIGWNPKLSLRQAVDLTTEWSKELLYSHDVKKITEKQIKEYFNL